MKNNKFIFIIAALSTFFLFHACKKGEGKNASKEMSGTMYYNGSLYNIGQTGCNIKTYSVTNPNYKPGDPLMIDIQGFELNLWTTPVGKSHLFTMQICGIQSGVYSQHAIKKSGGRIQFYENGNQYIRATECGDDSTFIELTEVNTKDKLISGKMYSMDKSRIVSGSDYWAKASAEFKNVKYD